MSKVEQPEMILKIVFAGDPGAGKTSLLRREAERMFTQDIVCTIGVEFKIKNYKVGKINVKAQLWDTAGQERYRSMSAPYYRGKLFLDSGCNAVLLCFSLADRRSFDNLGHWLDEINKYMVDGQIYLVGCKSDLDTIVPTDEILTFAEAMNVKYIQTSAKESIGVSEAFQQVIEETTQNNLIKMAYEPKQ